MIWEMSFDIYIYIYGLIGICPKIIVIMTIIVTFLNSVQFNDLLVKANYDVVCKDT